MVAGLINATGKVRRMLDEDKIRKVDIVLACLLFFDPTGGNGNTAYSVCRYALIIYLCLKNIRRCKDAPVPIILLVAFSILMAFSTWINTYSLTWSFSGFMFGLGIVALILTFLDSCKRYTTRVVMGLVIAVFAVVLLCNDVLMIILPHERDGSSFIYLIGNKFIVSYAHCLLSGLMLVRYGDKVALNRVFAVFGSIMAYVAGSSTGTMMMAVMFILTFLPLKARLALANPVSLAASVVVLNALIWGPIDLFQLPEFQNFIVNVLHKNANMTGREKLYAATLDFVAMKPLFGWGYLTDIYRNTFGYGNAQNGLFHLVTQCGILGTAAYFSGLLSALAGKLSLGKKYFGIYAYLFVMVLGSSVEINLSFQFAFAVALLCGALRAEGQRRDTMRVGIMTMHRIPNYGSFLQAYSLKKMIESLGHEVVFVDYHVEPDIVHRGEFVAVWRCRLMQLKQDLKATSLGQFAKKIVKGDKPTPRSVMFSCDYLLGVTDKRRYNTECDVLVIGSDEVFNCLQRGYNVGYSLELFGRRANAAKVISYAASFGNTTLKKLERYGVAKEIGECLKEMDELSVRDANSATVVEALTGEAPFVHLDPVLVGGAEFDSWSACRETGFVLLYGYSFRFTESECREVLDFAHRRGLKVIAVGEDQPLRDVHARCRPDEVLPYFSAADYVVTDTFHGTIFSVVTHTPFVTLPRGDKNGHGGNVQKLTSLLDRLDLSERRIGSIDALSDVLPREIDFKKPDVIRRVEAKRSLDYLSSCILNGSIAE